MSVKTKSPTEIDEDESKPWVEKYRPKTLDDIKSQGATINSLKKFLKTRALPHMIFTGPAGTGKTSTALAMINDLLGIVNVRQDAILERNASDEVRMEDLDEIKNFVNHTGIQLNLSFKFVILDEADNLSRDMQSALRRVIELAPANVKFIFLCNYVERIFDPILSRCAIFRFFPLPYPDFELQLKFIANQEHIKIGPEILKAIHYISQGDMRQAINLFQMVVALNSNAKERQNLLRVLDIANVYEISGYIQPNDLDMLMQKAIAADLKAIITYLEIPRGISSRNLLRQINDKILNLSEGYPIKEKILTILAEYDYRLTLEADQKIQLEALFAEIIPILQKK